MAAIPGLPAPLAPAAPAAGPPLIAYGLKMIKLHHDVTTPVMLKVFNLGTPGKRDDQDFIDYLRNLPPHYTANYLTANDYQRRFTRDQETVIFSNLKCDRFDVTLLHKCIRLGNEDVASLDDNVWWTDGDELENCLFVIKKNRNRDVHEELVITEADFSNKAHDMKLLLEKTLQAAKGKYDIQFSDADLDVHRQKVNADVDYIINANLCEEELVHYCSSSLIEMVSGECMTELRRRLPTMNSFNPVSFLNNNLQLLVSEIYTDNEIQNISGLRNVSYNNIVAEIQNSTPGMKIALLEGLMGIGKSILIALLVREWCEQSNLIRNLNDYKVVLYVHCQSTLSSFDALLENLLPTAYLKYGRHLKTVLKQCRILVLVDGYDQAATAAQKNLIKNILEQLQHDDAFMCTSRPECSSDFKSMALYIPSIHIVTHMRIKGITLEKRVPFAENTHEKMKLQTRSGRDTRGLVELMKTVSTCEQYRVPLNLTLATWLYDQDPGKVNESTTQTELYYLTHQLHEKKLEQQRLLNNPMTETLTRGERNRKVKNWLPHLYREELVNFAERGLNVEHLRNECGVLTLPENEMLAAFLSLAITDTPMGEEEVYSAPHRGLHSHYGALYVVTKLAAQPGLVTTMDLIMDAIPTFQATDLLSTKAMLQQVLGLLYIPLTPPLYPAADRDRVANEVVNLLHQANVTSRDEWLDVLEDVRLNSTICDAIAPHFPTGEDIVVEDGRVGSYSSLLPYLQSTRVEVNIKSSTVFLDTLPQALDRHTCTALRLHDHFRHPITSTLQADQILGHVLSRNSLEVLVGHVSGDMVPHLPTTLTTLYVALSSDQLATQLLPHLYHLPRLHHLGVHVTATVSPAYLQTRLPDVSEVYLYLSDIEEGREAWAAEVALRLKPASGYRSIRFPTVELPYAAWLNLINRLNEESVNIVGENEIAMPYPEIEDWD